MVTPFDAREITVLISGFRVRVQHLFPADLQRVPAWATAQRAMACLVMGGLVTVLEHFAAYGVLQPASSTPLTSLRVRSRSRGWALRIQRVAG